MFILLLAVIQAQLWSWVKKTVVWCMSSICGLRCFADIVCVCPLRVFAWIRFSLTWATGASVLEFRKSGWMPDKKLIRYFVCAPLILLLSLFRCAGKLGCCINARFRRHYFWCVRCLVHSVARHEPLLWHFTKCTFSKEILCLLSQVNTSWH